MLLRKVRTVSTMLNLSIRLHKMGRVDAGIVQQCIYLIQHIDLLHAHVYFTFSIYMFHVWLKLNELEECFD